MEKDNIGIPKRDNTSGVTRVKKSRFVGIDDAQVLMNTLPRKELLKLYAIGFVVMVFILAFVLIMLGTVM